MSNVYSSTLQPRRNDLDMLRVLAFGLLIFYHIGMFYVANWGYHVKSNYQSQSLETLMLLVNHWRLPLLFLISGLAIRFVLAKVSIVNFLGKRHLRLLLPLAFGVLVIVPPQLYYQMLQSGELLSNTGVPMIYWQFYQAFFDLNHPLFENHQAGILPHMDVNHLWYIRELWTFSIYLLILLPVLGSRWLQRKIDWLAGHSGWAGLLVLPLIPILVMGAFIDSESEAYRKALGFTFLVYGYLLGWHAELWATIKQYRHGFLAVALMTYLIIAVLYNLVWLNDAITLPVWGDWLAGIVRATNRWSWVLALLGFAAVHLSKPGKHLNYLNEAVYPYYILHQTIIVVAGYELTELKLGPVLEPLLLIVATVMGCGLLHEYIIRRSSLLRPLFGLKSMPKSTTNASPATEAAQQSKV